MKIVVATDKFKGTLSSLQACEYIRDGITQAGKDADVLLFPMADGGDGFSSIMKYYLHTQTITCNTLDPLMRNIVAGYEWDGADKTAIIELASASGLMLLHTKERDPSKTSTYGTGLLIKHAVDNGAINIILGLGGSATNDAAMGILAALGFKFTGDKANILYPTGEDLNDIKEISAPPADLSVHFTIATDVTNILYGEDGAAFVYASQKGADGKTVKLLDHGLKNFASVIRSQKGKDIASFPGSGAAGGVAAGLAAFFDIEIINGAQLVINASRIKEHLNDADLLVTGEGKIDSQTNSGKAVQQITALGRQYNIPVIAFCGRVDLSQEALHEMGLSSAHSLSSEYGEEAAIKNAGVLLPALVKSYFERN